MPKQHHFRSSHAERVFGPSVQPWDEPLLQSRNFVAVATLGAMVPGWVLVVPREPAICVGSLDSGRVRELEEFVAVVAARLNQRHGPAALFEHGPAAKRTGVGCGVDYAHLHLVPARVSLLEGARSIAPHLSWATATGLADTLTVHRSGQAYLYFEQPVGENRHIACGRHIPSQLFRRVIAKYIGEPDRYDWKEFPQLANVLATVESLQAESPSADVGSQ